MFTENKFSECRFSECENCMNNEYSENLICCAVSRLSLAFHKIWLEIPIINKFIDKDKYCNWFIKE